MARRRDEDGALDFPRRLRTPPSRVSPGRAGSLRVGPGADRLPEQLQTRFSVAPGLAPISASRFAVGPRDESEATGLVGYQEVTVPLRRRLVPFDTPAKVFYPAAVEAFEVVDGRRVRRGGGPNAAVAAAFGGWPVIVFAHGQTPGEGVVGADEDTLCEGVRLREGEGLALYQRWGTMQRALALTGFVSIAIDLSDRNGVAWRGGGGPIEDAARFLIDDPASPVSAEVDPARIGLVGHSAGSREVNLAAPVLGDLVPVAIVGPTLGFNPNSPSLIIGSRDDNVNGNRSQMFIAALPPKHKVFFRDQTHWAYFDGLCGEPRGLGVRRLSRDDAGDQRTITSIALRRFFDIYFRGADWPDDLRLNGLLGGGVEAEGEK